MKLLSRNKLLRLQTKWKPQICITISLSEFKYMYKDSLVSNIMYQGINNSFPSHYKCILRKNTRMHAQKHHTQTYTHICLNNIQHADSHPYTLTCNTYSFVYKQAYTLKHSLKHTFSPTQTHTQTLSHLPPPPTLYTFTSTRETFSK